MKVPINVVWSLTAPGVLGVDTCSSYPSDMLMFHGVSIHPTSLALISPTCCVTPSSLSDTTCFDTSVTRGFIGVDEIASYTALTVAGLRIFSLTFTNLSGSTKPQHIVTKSIPRPINILAVVPGFLAFS